MKKKILSVIMAVVLVFTMATPLVDAAPEPRTAPAMTSSDDLVRVLKSIEGFVAKPYWDFKQWTVGYGTACPDDKLDEYLKYGIPEPEAEKLFREHLHRFENAVNNFAQTHHIHFKQHQFDALVSFTYNCGTAWMYDLNGYFNTAIREQGTISELVYGFCLYSTAGGEYILINRRLSEANMYINGEYKVYYVGGGVPSYMRYVFLDGNGGELLNTIYGYEARQGSSIDAAFTKIPTGVDAEGNPFVYTLAGWYTSSGKKVEKLDGSLNKGQVLTARWADPDGNIVEPTKGTPTDMTVTVTGDLVNIRSGPGTQYEKLDAYAIDTEIKLIETYEVDGYTWGRTNLGWLRLDYTTYEEVKAALDTFPKQATVVAGPVNVRSGPSTDHEIVGSVSKGDKVIITEETITDGARWGKLESGNWVYMEFVRYASEAGVVISATLLSKPTRTEYVQMMETLHLEGCVILVTYSDGTSKALNPTRSMVTKYDNSKLGETTVNIYCEGETVSFTVTIVKATVTFMNYDGTVLASQRYAYGETVVPPEDPTRESDENYYYVFNGWDREVEPCHGNAVYTATFVESEAEDIVIVPQTITSDVFTIADGIIRKIALGTTVETLIQGINESGYIVVYSGETAVSGTATVTTGMTVCLEYEGEKIQTLTVAVTGDVHGDGITSLADALQIKGHVFSKEELPQASLIAADVNADGIITQADFLLLKANILGSGEIIPN